ncbi:MAG: hypothetical protein JW927_22710 [Deltaproteobacteria bacterium]|nr:hypothetical protein [Deltaproteobacteria bacterium]
MRRLIFVLAVTVMFAFNISNAIAAECDRECLIKMADDYISALVTHTPGKVPLADAVRTVENAKQIKPGEGLWKTATAGPIEFKIIVPDTFSQQVGGMVIMQSEGKPAQVGFRLKLSNGKIVEAEHLVSLLRGTEIPDTLKKVRPAIPMEIPYEYADSRGRLIHIARSYYDAVDLNNGNLAPFADDCDRIENGYRTAPTGGHLGGVGIPGTAPRPVGLLGMVTCRSQINLQNFEYISDIVDRRVEIADTKTGLAIGFSNFRHKMDKKEYRLLNDPGRDKVERKYDPFDMMAMHIYKIWGGEIHQIDTVGVMAPFNTPSGW